MCVCSTYAYVCVFVCVHACVCVAITYLCTYMCTVCVYSMYVRVYVMFIPYRTKVWREKSLANFTKSPNFIRQTSYHSITIVSIVTFSPNFIRQIDILHIFAKLFSRQTFVLYGMWHNACACVCRMWLYMTKN